MENYVLSDAYLSGNDEIKENVLKSDKIRRKALEYCYNLKDFEYLPLKEKNKIYDLMKARAEKEIEKES